MKKKVIRVGYADFWPGFVPERQVWHQLLSERYELVEVDRPDYLFDGGLGYRHLKFDCIKILKLAENVVPDFNCFDYAIGYDFLSFGDRYVRIPSYAFYQSYQTLHERQFPSDDNLLNRGFCSFVVSNAVGDPIRQKFFERLSVYKPVSSGGRWMNNVGCPVPDKEAFCRGFKFNIAFENSLSLGYTTEKLMQAFASNTVPIYYGNPLVTEDFKADSFVLVRDERDIERAVEQIVALDRDDEAYLKMCKAPCLVHDEKDYYARLTVDFLSAIFERPLAEASRLNRYGYQPTMRKTAKPFLLACQNARDAFWFTYDLLHGKIRRLRG